MPRVEQSDGTDHRRANAGRESNRTELIDERIVGEHFESSSSCGGTFSDRAQDAADLFHRVIEQLFTSCLDENGQAAKCRAIAVHPVLIGMARNVS